MSSKPHQTLDATSAVTLEQFAEAWSRFSKTTTLTDIKRDRLNWTVVFANMVDYLKNQTKKTTLVLDEVQWIAKQGSGFIGALKTAWVDLQRKTTVNIIVCGSSNRFFTNHVGGEEKILRGLQTRSTMLVCPLSLGQIKKYVLPTWSLKEIATTYMFLGGVPYYLNQLKAEVGFIQAINKLYLVQIQYF